MAIEYVRIAICEMLLGMAESQSLGQEVWDLHLAFVKAALDGSTIYSAGVEAAEAIREYSQMREEVLALDLILACGSATLPSWLRARSLLVARSLAPHTARDDEVRAYVDGWLRWHSGCGVEPPSWT